MISPTYPQGYPNGTCDHRIYVGSKNDVDIIFFDINLKVDPLKGECDAGNQDYVEVRGE